MKIFILTDMEGVSGIVDWKNYAKEDGQYWRLGCELLTKEVNAAIEGGLEAGADEFVVWAGHGGGTSITIDKLHTSAKFLGGSPSYKLMLDKSYDAMFLVGNHAMEGTPNANLNHTFSSVHVQGMKLNGKYIGEIGMTAAMAGWFNIPTILVTGDEAACAEAKAIIPDISAAPVKKGVSQFAAICLHPEKARELIREKAAEAVRRLGKIKPYKVKPPYSLEVEFRTTEGMSWRLGRKGIEKVDEKTIRVKSNDFIEIMLSW